MIKGVKKNKVAGVDKAPGTLIIERGAQILASGNANSPIVFTSNETSPVTGDWGGVVVLGKADVNICATCGASPSGTDKLGFIEGLLLRATLVVSETVTSLQVLTTTITQV